MMKLKPCPFCSDTHIRIVRTDFGNIEYQGQCLHCGATAGPLRETRDEAIKAWNARTSGGGEMNVYCPKCGGWYIVTNVWGDISPGNVVCTCDHCGTEWNIEISFTEEKK
jgi:Lar family restriction alleviation protein